MGHAEDMAYAYTILFINPEVSKPVRRPRHRDKDNIICKRHGV
jgi:hypothetical protein